jgi:uncharacterized membrane protein
MTTATINGYNISLWLHITAVMVGFGATFALSITTQLAMKLDPRHLPYVHELSLRLNRFFATPALVVVLLTGLYQVSKGNWKFGSAWISATFAILIVIGGLNGAYFIPSDKKLKALAERDIGAAGGAGAVTMSDEYNARSRTAGMVGALAGVLLVVAVFLMVVKPGA